MQHFCRVCCKYAAICSKLKKWEQSTVFPFIPHLKLIINANFLVAKNFFYKVSLYAAICRKMLQMCCKCSIIAFFQKFSFSFLKYKELVACNQNSSHSKYKYRFFIVCCKIGQICCKCAAFEQTGHFSDTHPSWRCSACQTGPFHQFSCFVHILKPAPLFVDLETTLLAILPSGTERGD